MDAIRGRPAPAAQGVRYGHANFEAVIYEAQSNARLVAYGVVLKAGGGPYRSGTTAMDTARLEGRPVWCRTGAERFLPVVATGIDYRSGRS